jgi:signal transduction histidine kinase/predicted DCC family thiol-disulfide oxidoreductase YuxK
MRHSTSKLLVILTVALTSGFVSVFSTAVSGADLRNVLEGYTITSWNRKDGLPTTHVRAIAQDQAGYLWIGTDVGLLRFDGVQFVPWKTLNSTSLPATSIRMLFGSSDGSIWVGFIEPGGITRIRPNGVVQNYGEADGLNSARLFLSSLSEDRRGAVWAGRSDGLYRFVDDRWERWTPGHGVPVASVTSTYIENTGNMVIGTTAGVFQLRDGQNIFERIGESDNPSRSIVADTFGRLWMTDAITGFRSVTDLSGSSKHSERGIGLQLLIDRKGYLWVASSQGLWRLLPTREIAMPPTMTIMKATALTGLLADGLTCLLEDRDGNIWVGTSDGLNRLTPHKVSSVTNLGFASAIESTADGIWVASTDELIHLPESTVESRLLRHRFDGTISTIHADSKGTIWVGTSRGVFRVTVQVGRDISIAHVLPLGRVNSITSDLDGGIWLSDQDFGLVRWDGNRLLPMPNLPRPILAIDRDAAGNIWAAADDGRVAVIARDRRVQIYDAHDGLVSGGYNAISEGHDGVIWLGSSDGLTRFANGRFATLRRSDNFPLQSFRAIVEDETGQLWIGTESGIVRVSRSELDQALSDPAHPIRYSLYDLSDGLAGFPLFAAGNRRSIRSKDGHLWFVTHRGLTVLDPHILQHYPAPAPVRIERFTAGDRQFRATSNVVLPPRTSRLEIEYAMLNLTSPLKTRFRYQLEGFDIDWIDAGPRRQAFYTNLPPRKYRFLVEADNNEGTWGGPATLDFSIAPIFYQTIWFSSVCITALVVAVWAAWWLHLRRVRKEFALILGERVRLSREIHDTLLQSLVGIALQCDAIADGVDSSARATKCQFLRMRRQVEEYIREARQSIWDLRSPKLKSKDLAEALRVVGERAIAGKHIDFEFTVSGVPHRCSPKVEGQLLRIGQEAILNAIRHSQANRVQMQLRYDDGSVALHVSDDGCGFDADAAIAATDEASGHYGLMTMKERADELGATLRIDSSCGRGTEVETVVPSAMGL